MIPTTDPPPTLQKLLENLREAQRLVVEARGTVDGVPTSSAGPVLLSAAPQTLLRGEIDYRQRAEEKAALLDALPGHIALLDRDGNVLRVNRAWRDFAVADCLSGEKHFGIGVDYPSACEKAKGIGEGLAAAVAAGVRSVLGRTTVSYSAEYACAGAQEPRWFQFLVSPMPAQSSYGAVVSHIDISELKAAERHTVDIKRRLETLVSEATIGILVHDDFKLIMANDAAARIFGYASKADLLEVADFRSLFAAHEQARVVAYYEARRAGDNAPDHYLVKARKRDGTETTLANHAFALDWGGRAMVCAMITDVTEQLGTEEQLRQSQKMEAVGQLTGGLAHDFNNLLMVILSGSDEILEQAGLSGETRRQVVQIGQAAERAAGLTRSLLAFSRKLPLRPQRTDINELVVNTGEMLRRTLGARVEINSVLADELWPVDIDSAQLENALVNLCLNSRDAMPAGGRLLIETANVDLDDDRIAQSQGPPPGAYVMLAVRDSGSGIAADVLDRVFEPFFTTKEVGKGTGLGLSMVYGFARQSGGGIEVSSELGVGTAIRLYLPRATDVAPAPAPPSTARAQRGSERILVVEDDPEVRAAVVRQLQSLGYTVGQAPDASAGLVAFEAAAQPYDLLLTDIIMPGPLSSKELAEAVVLRRPATRVLYMSGYSAEAIFADGPLKADIHLLSKPFRRLELANAVRRRLETNEQPNRLPN
jgi:PAS domain S-box-containing protein